VAGLFNVKENKFIGLKRCIHVDSKWVCNSIPAIKVSWANLFIGQKKSTIKCFSLPKYITGKNKI